MISRPTGIDQHSGIRRYGFEWRADRIVWFTYNDAGDWIKLREVFVALNSTMPLFMNNWSGDNTACAVLPWRLQRWRRLGAVRLRVDW